jgi:hypothetical protein
MTDNTTYSTGASLVAPAGYIFFSASATAVTDGRIAAARITDSRAVHTNLRNNAGTEIGTGTTPLSVKIENTSATASVILAAGTANIGTLNAISATVSTICTAFTEKTTGSLVQVADSANAALRVNVVAGSSGGVSQVDGTSFTSQAANFVPVGGIFDDAASDTLSENDAGVVRLTTNRAFHVNLRTDGGVKMDDSANTALRVNVVAGSAGGPSMTDNTTYSTGASLVSPAGFIFFSASATAVTDGRVAAARITDSRAIHVNFRNNAGTEIGTSTTPISVKVETQSATASVILAAGSANIGTLNNISATVVVSGAVSLAAGTSNIGTINNISATVVVSGAVSLAAGTSNIGFLNNISATVVVAGEIANGSSLSTTNKPVLMGGNTSAGGAGGLMATLLLDTSGRVILGAGAQNIGSINNISATVSVVNAAGTANIGAVSLGAGTANIGFINNISATLSTVLAAGTANIGTLNNISATLSTVLAAGTANIGTLNNISATLSTVLAAGTANIGTINNISAAVVLAAGAANIGTINNISATVIVAQGPSAITSVSHGPTCVTCSTSAVVTLVASPGAGLFIYITSLAVTNGGTVNGLARVGTSASAAAVLMYCASAGGGFVMNFNPPWKLSASEAALCSVKPNTSGNTYFNVNFYVAA